jgi:cobalt/nickel transport protein
MNPRLKSRRAKLRFFDGYTKTMLIVMFVILAIIFASAQYMTAHKMPAEGTDGTVNSLAAAAAKREHHPFIELPGDAEVGAFSVANLFAGLIIGYHWKRLFSKDKS